MKLNVIKRDNTFVPFDKGKIVAAINKAFIEVDGQLYETDTAQEIADEIEDAALKSAEPLSVEEIQNLVEDKLMECDRKDAARAYIRYRFKRETVRQSNTTDKSIKELLEGTSDYWNNENSNKNAKRTTVQRDYMAGIVSTDITRRFLLDKDIVEAHDAGIIHFHDADYFAQNALHNCFSGDTRFICDRGICTFEELGDDTEILVPTHTGEWKKAVVRRYGRQALYKMVFKNGCSCYTETIYATSNHRWILKDGTITTNLMRGQSLYAPGRWLPERVDADMLSPEDCTTWVKGFSFRFGTYDAVTDTTTCIINDYNRRFIDIFKKSAFEIAPDEKSATLQGFNSENLIMNLPLWENQIYANAIITSYRQYKDANVKGFLTRADIKCSYEDDVNLYHIFNRGGFYPSSHRIVPTRGFVFRGLDNNTMNWKCISKTYSHVDSVWCLEVEDNHSFILEHGIVTGNCELINLEDMLQNGTVVNGVLIEKPHRLLTATTIATQIIAAVTSSSYGGATISLTHLAPFVRESYQRYLKKYTDRGYFKDECKKFAKEDLQKEIEDAVQTFNYQTNSMTNTNG